MRLRISSSQAIVFLLSSCNALAQTCSINVTPMAFGSLESILSAPIDTIGGVSVNCDAQVAYLIRLDAGRNSSGSFQARRMVIIGGSEKMDYNLYRDSARTLVWGDGTGSSSIVSGVSSGANQNIDVYGRIFSNQNLLVGTYTDSVTVIVEW